MMPTEPNKPPIWRPFVRALLFVVVLFALVIGLGLAWLFTRPMPNKAELTRAEKLYADAKAKVAQMPTPLDRPTSAPLTVADSPTSSPAPGSALQARCDQLFREILEARFSGFDDPYWDWLYGDRSGPTLAREFLGRAEELAGFYDQGIRVSPEAKKAYCLAYSDRFSTLARLMARGFRPGDKVKEMWEYSHSSEVDDSDPDVRAEAYANLKTSLKFARVVDCPIWWYPALRIRALFFNLDSDRLTALPPELQSLDPHLLAPPGPVDWKRCVDLTLDFNRQRTRMMQAMCQPVAVYQMMGTMDSYYATRNTNGPKPDWSDRIYKNANNIFGALVTSRLGYPRQLQTQVEEERQFAEYAAWVADPKSDLPFSQDFIAGQLSRSGEQVYSRLTAAALELRQGAPVPMPTQIGPDSY